MSDLDNISETNVWDRIAFFIKVLKIGALIFIPYWIFGFEAGLFCAILVVCLFLSKISLTLIDIHEKVDEYMHKLETASKKKK